MIASTLRILALAALSTTAAAFADNTVPVDVPFSFVSHGSVYPAGRYDVSLEQRRMIVKIASRTDTKKQMMFLTNPANVAPTGPALRLAFDSLADGSHELRTIQIGTRTTSVLDRGVKHTATTELPFTGGR